MRAFPASALAHCLRRVLAAADPSRAADIAPLAADACERYHPQPSHRFRPLPKPAARKPSRKRTSAKSALASVDVWLEHVAKLAGVSRMTVSRALNHPNLLNKETLDRVREVIERSGYVPNMLAGAAASRRSRMVAAIVLSITNSIFVETIQALTDTLWDARLGDAGLRGYPSMREEGAPRRGAEPPARRDPPRASRTRREPPAPRLLGHPGGRDLGTSRRPPSTCWWGSRTRRSARPWPSTSSRKATRRPALVTADDERAEVRRRGFVRRQARERGASRWCRLRSSFAFDARAWRRCSTASTRRRCSAAPTSSPTAPRKRAIASSRCRATWPWSASAGWVTSRIAAPPSSGCQQSERVAIGREAARLILDRIEGDAACGAIDGLRIVDEDLR